MPERPPRFAQWLARWSVSRAEWPETLLGDLNERYERMVSVSPRRARSAYWRDALSVAFRYAPSRLSASELRFDVRHAWRGLIRSPIYTATIVITLALGIGASATIAGLIDTMFIRKLPVPAPEQIVALSSTTSRTGHLDPSAAWSPIDEYQRLRRVVAGIGSLAAYTMDMLHPGGALSGQPVWTASVSGNYFDALAVRPEIGRFLRADEETPEGVRGVAVISDHLWRSRFNADPSALGISIPIGRAELTIVGVAPPGFTGLHPEGRTDLWIPVGLRSAALGIESSDGAGADARVVIFVRRPRGTTVAQVQTDISHAVERLAAEQPAAYGHLEVVARVRDRLTTFELSPGAATMGLMIWIVVALLHLMVCTNVASLMLARAESKRAEVGVRLCLGASRTRIVLMSLTESMTLAVLGGAGGLLLARWLTTVVASMQFLSAADAGFDARSLVIAAGIAGLSVVQFGLLPAFEYARSDPLAVVRGVTAGGQRRRNRSEIAVLVQVAISVALLVDAAAFGSLSATLRDNVAGYDENDVIVASVEAKDPRTFRHNLPGLYAAATGGLGAAGGIDRLTAAAGAPLFAANWFGRVSTPDRARDGGVGDLQRQTSLQAIGPGYFRAIGATMLHGREFTPADRSGTNAEADKFDVAIVNEAAAKRYWPASDPLGRRITVDSSTATVVGVVSDIEDVSTISAVPRVYLPLFETSNRRLTLIAHVRGDTSAAEEAIRTAIQNSTLLRPTSPQTMRSIRQGVLAPSRVASAAFSGAAVVALSMACIGLYGLIAMWAARRRRELGIRLALGSTTATAYRLALQATGSLLATGTVLGAALGGLLLEVERSSVGPALRIDARFAAVALLSLAGATIGATSIALRRGLRGVLVDLLR